MDIINRVEYDLLLSENPCEVFRYFNVEEMHGLSLNECMSHTNNDESSYICGWCNYIPKPEKDYNSNDRYFVFINLKRCNSDIEMFGHLFHELMHLSINLHERDLDKEEEIITWAEMETHKVYGLIKYPHI